MPVDWWWSLRATRLDVRVFEGLAFRPFALNACIWGASGSSGSSMNYQCKIPYLLPFRLFSHLLPLWSHRHIPRPWQEEVSVTPHAPSRGYVLTGVH